MHQLAYLAVPALLGLAALPAHARTAWLCGLDDSATRLVCVADLEPAEPEGMASAQTAVVNGTTFPLDPRRRYVVELWTVPSDWTFVEQLARATICYRSPGCEVIVNAPPELARSVPPAPSARAAKKNGPDV